MKGKEQPPQIVYRKCDRCGKPVKSVLYRKRRLWDEYICLEESTEEEVYIFKVKSRLQANLELGDEVLQDSALLAVAYGSKKIPLPCPGGDGGTPTPDAIAGSGTITDNTGDMDLSMFAPNGDMISDPDQVSEILDFLNNLGIDLNDVLDLLS